MPEAMWMQLKTARSGLYESWKCVERLLQREYCPKLALRNISYKEKMYTPIGPIL